MYYRRLLKTGQITIPKEIQNQLIFTEGDFLFIYKCEDSIVIAKQHDNNTLNKCVFRDGRISIPAEIRRLLGITGNTLLILETNSYQDKLFIKAEKEGLIREA
jgi:AbrB family looped-hinge helix DNA binding protein